MHKTQGQSLHKALILIIMFIMVLPIVATLLYSLSTTWGATILPDGYTLDWFITLLSDPRF